MAYRAVGDVCDPQASPVTICSDCFYMLSGTNGTARTPCLDAEHLGPLGTMSLLVISTLLFWSAGISRRCLECLWGDNEPRLHVG